MNINQMNEAPIRGNATGGGAEKRYLTVDELMAELEPKIRAMFRCSRFDSHNPWLSYLKIV